MLLKNLVLIDGLNRSGKNSLAEIITSLKKSESIEMNYILEHIVEGLHLKLITKKFAQSFFEKFFNEIAYNKLLSRNSNFRKSDRSSVLNFSFPKIYKKRLSVKDGEHIFSQIKKSKNFFPFMTHEILPNIDVFENLGLRFKMISLFRNPFDIVYSWHKKNIIKKFGNKNFTLSFKYKKDIYPWYVHKNYKKWLKLKEMDQIAFIVSNLIEDSVKKYKKVKNKKKFIFLKYENYVQNPNPTLKKICKFLNTGFSSQTRKKIKKLKLPIKISENKRDLKIKFLQKNMSRNLFNKLKKLEKNYNKNFYGLK